MYKKVLLSGVTLLATLLAVGCSNNSAKSNNNDAQSSQTSKKSHKAKKHVEKHEKDDQEDQDSNSSNDSTSSDNSAATSQSSNTNSSSNNSNTNNSASSNNSNNQQASTNNTNLTGEQIFKTIVNDTIKRGQYPAGTGLQDFEIRDGNGVYSVAEKKTGTVVANYSVKNGKIYYNDPATGKETPLN